MWASIIMVPSVKVQLSVIQTPMCLAKWLPWLLHNIHFQVIQYTTPLAMTCFWGGATIERTQKTALAAFSAWANWLSCQKIVQGMYFFHYGVTVFQWHIACLLFPPSKTVWSLYMQGREIYAKVGIMRVSQYFVKLSVQLSVLSVLLEYAAICFAYGGVYRKS